MPLIEISVPFLHPLVELDDLHANQKLLAEDEITRLVAVLQNYPDDRYSKHDARIVTLLPLAKTRYSIIKIENEVFAIYKGLKHQKHIFWNGNGKKVKLAQSLISGQWYALKIDAIQSSSVDSICAKKKYRRIEAEIKNISQYSALDFKPVPKIIEKISTNQKISFAFLMPLLPGLSLDNFLRAECRLPNYVWLDIAVKILEATKVFHQQKILHRDMKLDNVMYDYINHVVTLIDFEYTRELNNPNKTKYIGELSGTLTYLAPEVLQARVAGISGYSNNHLVVEYNTYDIYSEIYALGILLKILFSIAVPDVPLLEIIPKNTIPISMYRSGHDKLVKENAQIQKVLNTMTAYYPADRSMGTKSVDSAVLIDEFIDYIKPIRDQEIKHSILKTALLDINQFILFFETANSIQKYEFFDKLKQFDEICLIAKNHMTNDYYKDLITLQRYLYARNIGYALPIYKKLLVTDDLGDIEAYFRSLASLQANMPRRYIDYIRLSSTIYQSATQLASRSIFTTNPIANHDKPAAKMPFSLQLKPAPINMSANPS